MSVANWILWAILLVAQNFAFTFVSRARNSGSLGRHMVAGLMSNGVWFMTQIFTMSQMLGLITGHAGWKMGLFSGVFYTIFTLVGSLLSHQYCLLTEKGKGAVGANSKFAQISKEEYESLKGIMEVFKVYKEGIEKCNSETET